MKLFGFNKRVQEEKFSIAERDRQWVEANFKWLIKVLGLPTQEQFLLNETYFPKTFKTEKLLIDHVIKDICSLLNIQEAKITYNLVKDIRDIDGMPYAIAGKPFETEL